jgi:hypothetical protein
VTSWETLAREGNLFCIITMNPFTFYTHTQMDILSKRREIVELVRQNWLSFMTNPNDFIQNEKYHHLEFKRVNPDIFFECRVVWLSKHQLLSLKQRKPIPEPTMIHRRTLNYILQCHRLPSINLTNFLQSERFEPLSRLDNFQPYLGQENIGDLLLMRSFVLSIGYGSVWGKSTSSSVKALDDSGRYPYLIQITSSWKNTTDDFKQYSVKKEVQPQERARKKQKSQTELSDLLQNSQLNQFLEKYYQFLEL